MSGPDLSARDRRALVLGALLLVPALVWSLLVAPYMRALDETESRLRAERELLQRELAMLAQIDRYPTIFGEGIGRLSEALPRLLSGESSGAMTAVLTRYVQTRAQQSGVLVSRAEPIQAPPVRSLDRIALKISGESDLQGIVLLLHSLEAGPTLVHVRDLRIQSSARPAAPGGAAAGPAMEVLTFEFVASGYALPPLQPTAAAPRPRGEQPPDVD